LHLHIRPSSHEQGLQPVEHVAAYDHPHEADADERGEQLRLHHAREHGERGDREHGDAHHERENGSESYALLEQRLGDGDGAEYVGVDGRADECGEHDRERVAVAEDGLNDVLWDPVVDECAHGHADKDEREDLTKSLPSLFESVRDTCSFGHSLGLLSIDSFSAHEVSHLVVHPQMLDDGAARNGDDKAYHRIDERHVRAEDAHDEDDGGDVHHGR